MRRSKGLYETRPKHYENLAALAERLRLEADVTVERIADLEAETTALGAAATALDGRVDVLEAIDIAQGVRLDDISLVAFDDNEIEHGLGRAPVGYLPVMRSVTPCNVHAYRSAADTSANGWDAQVLDAESYDDGEDYDPTTGLFTARTRGLHQVDFSVQLATVPDATTMVGAIGVNGSRVREAQAAQNGGIGTASAGVHAAVRLEVGDEVQPYVYQNSGGVLSLQVGASISWMSIRLVDDGITDRQATNPSPDESLILRCSFDQVVSLWVF